MESHQKTKELPDFNKIFKNKGYCLTHPLILLDKQKIASALEIKSIQFDLFNQIDSTNDYLKATSRINKLAICIAEMQTKGKGRFHRSWYSPSKQNIYLSLKYFFNRNISELAGLSLICGLAVCRAIETTYYLPLPIFIKWPNDIIYGSKKLAGVLIEIQAENHGFCSVVIGVGLNVNMQNNTDKKINQDWMSLINITEVYQDRNKLCAALINHLMHCLEEFKKYGFSLFENRWREKDYLFNKSLRLKSSQSEFQGIAAGINEQGNLILKFDGSQKAFSSGDVILVK